MPEPKRVSRPLLEAMLLSEYARCLEEIDPPSARMRCLIAQYKQALLEEARQVGAVKRCSGEQGPEFV